MTGHFERLLAQQGSISAALLAPDVTVVRDNDSTAQARNPTTAKQAVRVRLATNGCVPRQPKNTAPAAGAITG